MSGSAPRNVVILTTAHWDGDPRLNRHRRYLEAVGHHVELISKAGVRRPRAICAAIAVLLKTSAQVVLLPDPEMFAIGSAIARFRGKQAVIDIHEDYPKTAASRQWVPSGVRWLVSTVTGLFVALGRGLASSVVVAAPELATKDDILVMNTPDPAAFSPTAPTTTNRVVYVGDVTIARGAMEMAEVACYLDESFELVIIGRVPGDLRTRIESLTSTDCARVQFTGRLAHEDAWRLAEGAIAGLSLLQPVPAYRRAVATKLWEYMAAGLPPVVSDLPGQRQLVEKIDRSLICSSPEEVAAVIKRLSRERTWRAGLAEKSRQIATEAWDEARPDLRIQAVVAP